MLNTIQDVKAKSIIHAENGHRHMATLHVLYHQDPDPARDVPFIEIREWCTVHEDAYDLIAEWGWVDPETDELETECRVLLGTWGLAQALTFVNEQLAKRA